jgi:hypothetical protein
MTVTLERSTQICLNRLNFGKKINEDGVIGRVETIPMLQELDKYLQSEYKRLGYWSTVEQEEYVGIRISKKYTNQFSDVGVMWRPNRPELTRLVEMSTLPGTGGRGAILNPVPIYTKKFPNGYTGTAVLQPGRYRKSWFIVNENGTRFGGGFFRQWSGGPYLMQCAPVLIGRDGDRDLEIDPQVFETDNNGAGGVEFGINHHGYFSYEGNLVNNISLGCQVFQRSRLNWMYSFWTGMINWDKDRLITYTLINRG